MDFKIVLDAAGFLLMSILLLGINSMKVTPGISFAIPIDYAKEFLAKSAESAKSGKSPPSTKKRYIGITMLTLNPQV